MCFVVVGGMAPVLGSKGSSREAPEASARWPRTEQRAVTMLLSAMPEEEGGNSFEEAASERVGVSSSHKLPTWWSF